MTAHLILTVDYEVFGNGQGCVNKCIVEPAYRILRVADQFNAPVTLFAEAAEFVAMERHIGPQAVAAVKEQLASAASAGHDVQLHLHPQWMGATRRVDGTWALDLNRWRMGGLSQSDADESISTGRDWINQVAYASAPGRSCFAFRAGSWCIQPSERVLRSLAKHAFIIESTVVPGMRRPGDREWSDFRGAPELPFWRVSRDVCQPSASGLWEVPIASAHVDWVDQVFELLKSRTSSLSGFAPGCCGSYSTSTTGRLRRVKNVLQKVHDLNVAKLDFSTHSSDNLSSITSDWMRRFSSSGQAVPVVAIAHTKNWTERSSANLARYLKWAQSEGVQLSTYRDWLNCVSASESRAANLSSAVSA